MEGTVEGNEEIKPNCEALFLVTKPEVCSNSQSRGFKPQQSTKELTKLLKSTYDQSFRLYGAQIQMQIR